MLSVITPARNMARYLPDTLESVAALRTPHEHIVIDGDSDDGTVELLEGREDPHLTWISEPDSGQTEAVNKGLRLARGRPARLGERRRRLHPEGGRPRARTPRAATRTSARSSAVSTTWTSTATIFRTLVPPRFSWRTLPLLRRLRHHADDHLAPRAAGPGALAERGATSTPPTTTSICGCCAGRGSIGSTSRCSTSATTRPARRRPTSGSSSTRRRRSGCAGPATRFQRGIMRGWEGARRAILPRISSWPHPEPRGVVKLLRRIGARG